MLNAYLYRNNPTLTSARGLPASAPAIGSMPGQIKYEDVSQIDHSNNQRNQFLDIHSRANGDETNPSQPNYHEDALETHRVVIGLLTQTNANQKDMPELKTDGNAESRPQTSSRPNPSNPFIVDENGASRTSSDCQSVTSCASIKRVIKLSIFIAKYGHVNKAAVEQFARDEFAHLHKDNHHCIFFHLGEADKLKITEMKKGYEEIYEFIHKFIHSKKPVTAQAVYEELKFYNHKMDTIYGGMGIDAVKKEGAMEVDDCNSSQTSNITPMLPNLYSNSSHSSLNSANMPNVNISNIQRAHMNHNARDRSERVGLAASDVALPMYPPTATQTLHTYGNHTPYLQAQQQAQAQAQHAAPHVQPPPTSIAITVPSFGATQFGNVNQFLLQAPSTHSILSLVHSLQQQQQQQQAITPQQGQLLTPLFQAIPTQQTTLNSHLQTQLPLFSQSHSMDNNCNAFTISNITDNNFNLNHLHNHNHNINNKNNMTSMAQLGMNMNMNTNSKPMITPYRPLYMTSFHAGAANKTESDTINNRQTPFSFAASDNYASLQTATRTDNKDASMKQRIATHTGVQSQSQSQSQSQVQCSRSQRSAEDKKGIVVADTAMKSEAVPLSTYSDGTMKAETTKSEPVSASDGERESSSMPTGCNSFKRAVVASSDERKFKCNFCDKQYKHLCNLKSHQKVHTDEALICPHCDKRFGRKANYKEHLRIHTGETPYQCKFCQRKFKHHHSWKDHIRIHTGEKPYQCDICNKKFKVGHNLTVHLRIHTGEKPYSCGVCMKAFRQKSALNSHVKRVHHS